MLSTALPLSEWESFYVIIGSSGAALTGLMFVVVTLTAERSRTGVEGLRAFATPTVVHFGAVLLLAAILTTPGHTSGRLGLCLGACGLAGLAYMGSVVVRMRRQYDYEPELEDRICHVVLPIIAYAGLLGAVVTLSRNPHLALDAVAVVALLLLFTGIHNAWDAAVWMARKPPEDSSGRDG